jgi:hypothetical protein
MLKQEMCPKKQIHLISEALLGRIIPSLSDTHHHRYRQLRRRGFLRKLLERRL